MRLNFNRIEIHNFLSFSDEIFEFDKQKGLNLVCGKNNDIPGSKNGCGKSNVFDALVFSLYGQSKDNIKNSNIANKFINSKEVRVVTYFDIDGKSYKVASGHNKNGQPYCQLYEIDEDGNEVDMTKSTMSETRKYLVEEILHCDLSIFLRTVLLSADQNYNFFRLKKGDKKEFIEKLFDISVFGKIYEKIHRDVLDVDKAIIAQQNKIIVLNKNNDDYKQRKTAFYDNSAKQLKILNESLTAQLASKQKLLSKNVSVNTAEVDKYESMADKVHEAIRKVNDKIAKAKNSIELIAIKMKSIDSDSLQKQKVIDKHAELLSKLCKDCKKIFSDYYSISKYEKAIEQNSKEHAALTANREEQNASLKSYQQMLESCNEKLRKIDQKIQSLTEVQNQLNVQLQHLDQKISSTEAEISHVEKAENPYEELFQSCQIEIAAEKEQLAKQTERYKYIKYAENVVSQDTLRKFIISDLIGLLNSKIKTYLTKFGAKYQVIFDSDMNYTFVSDGVECEYDNFSSGEKARLMIASCFAFRDFMYIRNSFSSNILVLDEFIDSAIDGLAIESILEILKDFSVLWNQNIFCISHRTEMSNDVFDHVIQLVKTNNISKIEYLE